MRPRGFAGAVREIKWNISKLVFFDTSINAIVVFLVSLLVLSVFDLPLVYPILVSAVYFAYVLRRRLKQNKIRVVESKYANLNEKLRTAAEFERDVNPVVKELHSEVISDLRRVEEAAFINEKRIYTKAIVIVALCFVILLLSPVTLGLLNFNFSLVDSPEGDLEEPPSSPASGSSNARFAVGSEDRGLRKSSGDIYATPSIAVLGDEEIKVQIRPAGSEFSIRDVQEADLPDFSESYPSEVEAVTAESFEEEIPKEELELVKNYFNELAKG